MTTILDTDLTVPQGAVRTYVQSPYYYIGAALVVGAYEAIEGQVYYEPSIINRGEMHLDNPNGGQGTLIHFRSSMSWDYAVFENYGLISAVVPDNTSVRAIYSSDRAPNLYNAGTIVAQASSDAVGIALGDAAKTITNAVTGIVEAKSTETAMGIALLQGGSITNDGQILAHSTDDGRSDSWAGARAVAVAPYSGFSLETRIANTGLIQATDEDPGTRHSTAIYFRGDGFGTIVNSGTIRGDFAVMEQADSSSSIWEESGITISNSGLVAGHVSLDLGDDVVENSGRIAGYVELGRGNDSYEGALGTITGAVRGGAGHDRLAGGAGDERFVGGAGNDVLVGRGGIDVLSGASGADIVNGGRGADWMSGGDGDDIYLVDDAGDHAVEKQGADGVDRVRSFISLSLGARVENLVLKGGASIDGDGNGRRNIMTGNKSDNELSGEGGRDILRGEGGDDHLHGGVGRDRLTGGAGADLFYFDTTIDGADNVDRIIGFAVWADTLVLDDAVFAGLATGVLEAGAFHKGSAAADAGDRVIYNPETGALLFDADGAGGAAAVQFAVAGTDLDLRAADFLVI